VEIQMRILAELDAHPLDVAAWVARRMAVSRTAVSQQIKILQLENVLVNSGSHSRPSFSRGLTQKFGFTYDRKGLEEDVVWRRDIRPILDNLTANILAICQHGVTEMVNNTIDHSGGRQVDVMVLSNATRITIQVRDDGVGIFRKITKHLALDDERHALLELSKGKFTTDPQNHPGEGIFFTSRLFDEFMIVSHRLTFNHDVRRRRDFLIDHDTDVSGTKVVMAIERICKRTLQEVFSEYSSGPDDFSFAKTVIPMRMAKVGDENLTSRSQAKRVILRFEKFQTVILDFAQVSEIGQAFADEIFRVFANNHPATKIIAMNATAAIQQMVNRAQSNR
jgi:anti-sigma regulatory factor (Ser/Thr protein kinase)